MATSGGFEPLILSLKDSRPIRLDDEAIVTSSKEWRDLVPYAMAIYRHPSGIIAELVIALLYYQTILHCRLRQQETLNLPLQNVVLSEGFEPPTLCL